VTVYLLPAVAILLGAAFRDETVHPVSVAGTVLVAAGAYLTSRSEPNSDPSPRKGANHDRQPAVR